MVSEKDWFQNKNHKNNTICYWLVKKQTLKQKQETIIKLYIQIKQNN